MFFFPDFPNQCQWTWADTETALVRTGRLFAESQRLLSLLKEVPTIVENVVAELIHVLVLSSCRSSNVGKTIIIQPPMTGNVLYHL